MSVDTVRPVAALAPAARERRCSGAGVSTFRRAVVDQLRMHASSPVAILATLAMPCVIALVVHDTAGSSRGTSAGLAVGSAGVGMLDSVIVLIVFSFLSEKNWRTLLSPLGSPIGFLPVLLGRLTGIALQSTTALPGTLLVLGGVWGLEDDFSWARWAVGGATIALATTSVVGLLGLAVLRFPYSSGMTNGLTGLAIAPSALIVPAAALPVPLRLVANVLPQSHAMAWVRGGGDAELALTVVLTAGFGLVLVGALRRIEHAARRRALALEA